MNRRSLEIEWYETLQKIGGFHRQGNFTQPVSEIESFLSRCWNVELQGEALGYKALFREEMGELEGAKEDLLKAHSLSRPMSHPRFGHEMGLGYLCERQGLLEEALFWFRAALLTARDARRMSAGSALRRFLRLRGEANLTAEEHSLCLIVARQSWEFLQLPGEPDTTNLEKTAGTIIEGESRSRKERQS